MNDDSLRVPIVPPLIYALSMTAGIILHLVVPWQLFMQPWIGQILGWPIIVVGLLLFVWAVSSMLRGGEHPDIHKPTQNLISSGPFAFSRNPIYLSFTVIYLGIALVVNTIWLLVFLPVVLSLLHYTVIQREEQYLAKVLGDEYLKYKGRVRRWL